MHLLIVEDERALCETIVPILSAVSIPRTISLVNYYLSFFNKYLL